MLLKITRIVEPWNYETGLVHIDFVPVICCGSRGEIFPILSDFDDGVDLDLLNDVRYRVDKYPLSCV
jgi:hypothetical protein